MGLLDDLLGQLTSGAGVERQRPSPQRPAGANIDMQRVMMALLPVVLAMLARRQQAGRRQGELGSRTAPGGTGGGLGDILGGLLGGGGGPAASGTGLGSDTGLGGLGSLIEGFQRAGFGKQAQSWVSTGRNEAISPAAVEAVFGPGALGEIARQAGLNQQETGARTGSATTRNRRPRHAERHHPRLEFVAGERRGAGATREHAR